MIKRISGLPDNVLGFTATGMVTATDYESVIMPAVEAAFARHEKLRFLYHLGRDFTGFEAGAIWDDTRLGLKHLLGWAKIAVVSDMDWIRVTTRAFGFAMPGHARVFRDSELSEAMRWVAE